MNLDVIQRYISDLDLDDTPVDKDADNSVLANGSPILSEEEHRRLLSVDNTARLSENLKGLKLSQPKHVPFLRPLHYGNVGYDVLALKRALSKAGFRDWGKWGTPAKGYGAQLKREVAQFQKKNHLPVTGRYDEKTHSALSKYFDSYGVYLLLEEKKTFPVFDPKKKQRLGIVNTAIFGYHNRDAIHYTESGLRMYGVRNHIKPPQVTRWEDCSSFATWCYWVAGAPDPNGLGYNGQGFTGTLIQHGTRVTHPSLSPGDLIFFGHQTIPSHVAIYIGSNRIVSHGSEGGPYLLPWNYRSDIHSMRSYI